MKTFSIIIPVFNEEKTIATLLEKVNNVRLPLFKKEIIVVDDCSFDETAKILKSINNINFKYLKHKQNLGKGAAIRSGLKKASGEYIIIQDADLEYNPEDYIRLLEAIINKNKKVVFGTRLTNYPLNIWGKHKTTLPIHLVANKFLTALVNLLYGSKLTDMETCYKLFHKDVIKNIELKSNRFEIEPEITIKILKLGHEIFEVPIKVKPRNYKEGKKIGFSDGLKAIKTIIKYRFTN